MLDWMFISILFIAIIILLLIMLYQNTLSDFWLLALIIFDMVLWWMLAMVNTEIEIPYQMYNATSGNIETGYQRFSSLISPTLIYVFSVPAILLLCYFVYNMYLIVKKAIKG